MKCINCGNRIKKNAKYCDNCGIDQSKIEVISINNKSNKLFIFVIIILLLLGCLLGFIIINHNSNKDKKENKELIIDDTKEIILNNYKLTISDDYKVVKNDSSTYIKGNDYTILYSFYPLSYSHVVKNKEILTDELKNQGYIIKYFNEFENDKYILIEGSKDELEYGFIFYEFDTETNIFVTITSNYLNHFNKNWFNDTIKILKTSEKIEK